MKSQAVQLSLFADYNDAPQRRRVVNVATVPQRSPFRYPGGKTWLVPIARQWFAQAKPGAHLIEPFAGGGIIGLTAAAEYQFERITLVERDDDMAAAWQTILSGNCQWLMERIASFQPTAENIRWAISRAADGIKERGFATIVRNRTNHGGILADGAGMIRNGENGKGLGSRWYPATLNKRIDSISRMRHRIEFIHGDAFEVMEQYIDDTRALFFIDPPYTVAGRRLYTHHAVNHHRIFELVKQMRGHFMLTYNDSPEVRNWAKTFGLPYTTVPMQTTHLRTKDELLISDSIDWIART